MRFMIIVKATKESEAGVMPEEKLIAAMGAYHEELEDFAPSEAIDRMRELDMSIKSK